MTQPPDRAPTAGHAPAVGQVAVDQLLEVLDLRQVDPATFHGISPQVGAQRVFGGQVAGQALVAAGRTVDPRRLVHSLHGYFVRPGDPSEPIEYRVERIRDGRSFSVRRSVALQHSKTIFFMSASFHVAEAGLDHHAPLPADVPGPDETPTMADRLAAYPERLGVLAAAPHSVDVRYVGEPIAAVVADNPYLAADAAELVRVEYEPLPAVVDAEAAMSDSSPRVHEGASNVVGHIVKLIGDVDRAFADADVIVEDHPAHGRVTSMAIETRGLCAAFDPAVDAMTVWAAHQARPFSALPSSGRTARTLSYSAMARAKSPLSSKIEARSFSTSTLLGSTRSAASRSASARSSLPCRQ